MTRLLDRIARLFACVTLAGWAGSCGASPPPVARDAPHAKVVRPPRAPWLELTGSATEAWLTSYDAEGRRLYSGILGGGWTVTDVTRGPLGGAAVLRIRYQRIRGGNGGEEALECNVLRVSSLGQGRWVYPLETCGKHVALATIEDRVLVFNDDTLLVVDDEGRLVKRLDEGVPRGRIVARDGVVIVVGPDRVTRLTRDAAVAWSVGLRGYPAADPWRAEPLASSAAREEAARLGGTLPLAARAAALGYDATLLTGAADGSLVALTKEGAPLFELGVRGEVSAIDVHRNGDFIVRTTGGRVTLVSPDGDVRSEDSTEAPLALAKLGVVDARVDSTAAAATKAREPTLPLWKPTLDYRVRRVSVAGRHLHGVRSVVPMAANDVWALAPWLTPGDDAEVRLFHYDGRGWSDQGAPFVAATASSSASAGIARFEAEAIARGPGGGLVAIGDCYGETHRKCVFDRTDQGFRERRELGDVLSKIDQSFNPKAAYAASPNGREVLCINMRNGCFDIGHRAPRLLTPEDYRTAAAGPDSIIPFRNVNPVFFAGETLWRANGWSNGANDLWTVDDATITHFDGSRSEDLPSPMPLLQSVWATGEKELWVSGPAGVARFDGKHWWRVPEIPGDPESSNYLSVVGTGPDDLWVFGDGGLWHVTPDPGARPPLHGAPGAPPPASRPRPVLTADRIDTSYRLDPVVIEVAGAKRSLRTAVMVVEGPNGVLWFHEGSRIIEYDGAKARVIWEEPKPEPFVCWSSPEVDCEVCAECTVRRPFPLQCRRCVATTEVGQGAIVAEDRLLRIEDGKVADDRLMSPLLVGVAASPSGALWSVFGHGDPGLPLALVEASGERRMLTGLPPAIYIDLAVQDDDDVWFAGGLTKSREAHANPSLPGGEGTLVHFDGQAFTRYRGPEGALLAVTTTGPQEAWAVGLRGGVLRVKASRVRRFRVGSEATLRGVSAAGPDDVFIVGDRGTVLRWDGATLRRLDTSAVGSRGAFAAVVAPQGKRPGFVVGPSGIWRIERTSGSSSPPPRQGDGAR